MEESVFPVAPAMATLILLAMVSSEHSSSLEYVAKGLNDTVLGRRLLPFTGDRYG